MAVAGSFKSPFIRRPLRYANAFKYCNKLEIINDVYPIIVRISAMGMAHPFLDTFVCYENISSTLLYGLSFLAEMWRMGS